MPALGESEEEEEEDAESKDPLPEKLQNSMVNLWPCGNRYNNIYYWWCWWWIQLLSATEWLICASGDTLSHCDLSPICALINSFLWFCSSQEPCWLCANSNYNQKINSHYYS